MHFLNTDTKISNIPFTGKSNIPKIPPHRLQCDTLAKLVRRRKWDDVKATLKCLKSHYLICSTKCSKDCSSSHGILHHVCCYQPPLSIIKIIVDSYGDGAVYEQDCLNRYPLRAAIEYDAPYPVIAFLLQKNPSAAIQKCASDGNTPMHVHMKSYEKNAIKHRDDIDTFNDYFVRVIRLLSQKAPLSLTQKNNSGLVPSEIAVQLNVTLKSYKLAPKSIHCTGINSYHGCQKKLKIIFFNHLQTRRRSITNSSH